MIEVIEVSLSLIERDVTNKNIAENPFALAHEMDSSYKCRTVNSFNAMDPFIVH